MFIRIGENIYSEEVVGHIWKEDWKVNGNPDGEIGYYEIMINEEKAASFTDQKKRDTEFERVWKYIHNLINGAQDGKI